MPTAMLVAGLFIGAILASPSPASTSAPNENLVVQQTQVTSLETQVDALTAERDQLKSEVASYTAAADAEAKTVADEAARVAAEDQAAADAAAKATAAAAAAKTAAASAAAPSAKKSSGGGTVYITRTGEKYHQGGCKYLSQSKISISLANAQAQGYDACSVCY